MRRAPACLLVTLIATPALAQPRPARPVPPRPASHAGSAAPHAIGKFEDWTAVTHQEAGQTVCYAFTRAASATPLPGRGDVVLTVTERPGGLRDTVAISAGFAYATNTEATVQVDATTLAFYTSQRSAFARDGRAAAGAFERGRQAIAKSAGPRGVAVVDTFSLRGFSPAFAAIKTCSARG